MARLAPLSRLVVAQERGLVEAAGSVLALPLQAKADLPPQPIAYADGWAVKAEDLIGSTAYGAALLSPKWVDAGDALPDGDAVLAPEGVTLLAPDVAEAVGSVVPGEGVRLPGQDVAAGEVILDEGTRLQPRHIGFLRACGFQRVAVRVPQVRIVIASAAAALHGPMIRAWLEAAGANVEDVASVASGDRGALAALYRRPGADIVVSLGGTGQGRNDCAVAALADAGAVAVQGVALRPGATAAFGSVESTPVLLLPGRLDAMIAVMLVLAMPAFASVSGLRTKECAGVHRLVEKVSSAIGLSELFLGLPAGDAIRAVPLAEARLDALAQSAGWFIVPPASEGLAAGQNVRLRPFHPG